MLATGLTPLQTVLETQQSVGYNLRHLIPSPDEKGLPPPHGGGNAIRAGREVERRVLVDDGRIVVFEYPSHTTSRAF